MTKNQPITALYGYNMFLVNASQETQRYKVRSFLGRTQPHLISDDP